MGMARLQKSISKVNFSVQRADGATGPIVPIVKTVTSSFAAVHRYGLPVELRLFGGVRGLRDGDELELGGPRQRFVLAILAIECGQVVASERLIDILWPDSGDKKLGSLHVHISNLRRALDPLHRSGGRSNVLVRQPPGYRLDVERASVDVLRFEDLVVAGRRHLAEQRAATALASFSAAIALWSAPPLPELANEPVAIAAIARWHGLLGVALGSAASLHLDADDAVAALLVVEHRVAEFPLDERLRGLAALAMYRVGRQTDALRLIDQTRAALRDSSGLDLSDDLVRLERSILQQDPALRPPAARRAIPATRPVDVSAVEDAPGHVLLAGASTLVGRDPALGVLRAAIASARAGRGGVVHVSGPPGIGKTALVEAATDEAASSGVVTLWGRCSQAAGAPPFWPIIELERQLLAAGVLSPETGLVDVTMMPDCFLVADRIADLLVRCGRPMVLVIDDLQAADDDSLRVLVHLFAPLRRSNVLLVIIAHPVAGTAREHLLECTAELARQRVAEVAVHELTEVDVAQWSARRFGRVVRAELVSAIHERTRGNPLFLRELLALVEPQGDIDDEALGSRLAAVPDSLVAVVRRRVSALGAPTQRLLTMAAALGPSIDVGLAADVAGISAELALDQLSAALDAGLVVAGGGVGAFRFSHGIVAEALSAELNEITRAGLHAAAARSLARRRADDAGSAAVALH
ncbi:MAG: hypothetical protein JWM12_1392, partial [Ilumatobacteraceae bacterium]|nr:hypothetical protein [Ilumatobacteraceae bacterium]